MNEAELKCHLISCDKLLPTVQLVGNEYHRHYCKVEWLKYRVLYNVLTMCQDFIESVYLQKEDI